jgi:hypothetical protein
MSLGFETIPGRKGATSARREMLDPINLVSRIMKEHPRAGVDEICRRVRVALAGPDAEYQDAFNNYATRNHFNLLYKDEKDPIVRRSKPRPKAVPAVTAEQEKVVAERVGKVTAAVKGIVLMELPTALTDANGNPRPLGDLNEAEGNQLTGWAMAVFDGIGKRKLRDARTEAELQTAREKFIVSAHH